MRGWVAALMIVAGGTAAATEEPKTMQLLRADNMLHCHFVAEHAAASGETGTLSKGGYETVSRLARTAMGMTALEELKDATYKGFGDYVLSEMWNASKLHNQKAIVEMDIGDTPAIERFLFTCLIHATERAIGTAEHYRLLLTTKR